MMRRTSPPGRPAGGRRAGRVLSGGMSTPEPDVHALAGAYALDALPDDEARFFEDHLTFCAACRDEVAGLRATASRLGATVAERAPQGLRHRLLAEIDVTRQARVLDPTSPRELRRNPLHRLLGVAAAVMVIVTIALGALVAHLSSRVGELEQRSAQVYRVLAAADVRSVTLEGPDAPTVSMAVSEQEGQAVLITEKLPRLGDDQVYELWLVGPDGPRPAGLFRPDEHRQVVHVLAAELSGVQAVAVTIEPRGGSPSPTSDPLLFGEM